MSIHSEFSLTFGILRSPILLGVKQSTIIVTVAIIIHNFIIDTVDNDTFDVLGCDKLNIVEGRLCTFKTHFIYNKKLVVTVFETSKTVLYVIISVLANSFLDW